MDLHDKTVSLADAAEALEVYLDCLHERATNSIEYFTNMNTDISVS